WRFYEILQNLSWLLLNLNHQQSTLEQTMSFNAVVEASGIHVAQRFGFRDDFARCVENQLAPDVHFERCEIQCVQWCEGQQPYVIFGFESMPDLAKHRMEIVRIAVRPDKDHDF